MKAKWQIKMLAIGRNRLCSLVHLSNRYAVLQVGKKIRTELVFGVGGVETEALCNMSWEEHTKKQRSNNFCRLKVFLVKGFYFALEVDWHKPCSEPCGVVHKATLRRTKCLVLDIGRGREIGKGKLERPGYAHWRGSSEWSRWWGQICSSLSWPWLDNWIWFWK